MLKVNYHEEFTVTMELKQSTGLGWHMLGYHLRETWRSKAHGGIERPAGLPPVVAYDPETGRRIYQAWPDKDGKFRGRENGLPTEIYETEDQPHMKWHDIHGDDAFIAWPTEVKRNPKTGEIVECVYDNPTAEPCNKHFIDYDPPSLDFLK